MEIKPILKIPFITDDVWLVDYGAAPYVPLEPLCRSLGLKFASRLTRIQNSRKPFRLKTVRALVDEKEQDFDAIPLENLSWFLNTLNPRDATSQLKLGPYADRCARIMLFFWSRYQREYAPVHKVAAELSAISRKIMTLAPPPEDRGKTRDGTLTVDDINKMKEMHLGGISKGKIAKHFGYSRTTVSLAISGKYNSSAGRQFASKSNPRQGHF